MSECLLADNYIKWKKKNSFKIKSQSRGIFRKALHLPSCFICCRYSGLYSDLQLTLTTTCLCPQTVCQHCTHSHKPEIPNPDYRDISSSVSCLSLCLFFIPFSISSCHPFLSLFLQNTVSNILEL